MRLVRAGATVVLALAAKDAGFALSLGLGGIDDSFFVLAAGER